MNTASISITSSNIRSTGRIIENSASDVSDSNEERKLSNEGIFLIIQIHTYFVIKLYYIVGTITFFIL